jgi:hypothetical protein
VARRENLIPEHACGIEPLFIDDLLKNFSNLGF